MIKHRLTFLLFALLLLSLSTSVAAASPEDHRPSQPRQALDWNAYPADIQQFKVQLDAIRAQQKELFQQIKAQHEQIRKAREALTPEQRKQIKTKAKPLVMRMHAIRSDIGGLRQKKHEVWENFHEHTAASQWKEARNDMESMIKLKQEILGKQQHVLELQRKLAVLLSPLSHTHL